MEGYGVFLSRMQLDDAIDHAGTSPKKLVFQFFFTPEVMATSSIYGTRHNPALDKAIISACISKSHVIIMLFSEFVMNKMMVSWSVLVDAINDKCAQFRRPPKRPCKLQID